MSIELWGMQGPFHLGLPLRLSGLPALGLLSAILLVVFVFGGKRSGVDPTRSTAARAVMTLALLLLAPFASQLFLVHLGAGASLAAPGVPFQSPDPVFSIFGDLPWMLAAGWLGVRPAIWVGLASGLARAGWETGSLLTPIGIGLQAGLVAIAMRNSYTGWAGRALRLPLIAGWLGSFAAGALRAGDLYFASSGTGVDGLAFAVAAFLPWSTAALAQSSLAGAPTSLIRVALPEFWFRPARLEAPPWGRTLSARMVALFAVLGAAALAAVSAGEWFLAQAAAVDLLESQMRQSARQSAAGVPYFIQAGRSLVGDIAREASGPMAEGSVPEALLDSRLRLVPFFSRLEIYDVSGARIASLPAGPSLGGQEFDSAVLAALAGVPQEVVLPPELEGAGVQLVFFAPILVVESGTVMGALAGWTDLEVNPFLQPVSAGLLQAAPGVSFLVDELGRIVLDAAADRSLEVVALNPAEFGTLQRETAPDGTARLVLVQAVDGYPWRVVVVQPQGAVDRLAIQISIRLLGVLLAVGVTLLVAVYGVSHRLTRPLRVMARIAESIARGNLAQPVPVGGGDELGRLAASFERMRLALRNRLDEMDLLLAASQGVAASFELARVMPPILEGVRELTRADLVRLALEPSGVGRADAFHAGIDPGHWGDLDGQVLALAQQHGRFVLENPARARAVLDLDALDRPIKAMLGLPIRHEAEFVGALWLAHRKPHAFSRDEVNLLTILGGQLGVAISNARLFQQAEQERSRLAAVLEATPDAVVVIDREGMISLANPAADQVLRGAPGESKGKAASEWLQPPELLELIGSGDRESRAIEVRLENGRVLFASAAEVAGQGDEPLGRVVVLWDISHYKKLDMLKSEFVSTVSHDLRSPLTLMRGYATMMTMVGATNEQQREFVRKILDSVDQMARLVDNLLDLGRIEAGVGLNLERLPLEPLLEDVAESLRPQAATKQVVLRLQLDEAMEPVDVDPTLFRQAVANLVENAIKYTPSGGSVTLRAFQAEGRQMVRVVDTGLGIAPTDQARLFERFYRARRKETLREKGTGLGLAIVKSIAEQHGGRVSIESRLGAGSTFSLEIPLRQGASAPP